VLVMLVMVVLDDAPVVSRVELALVPLPLLPIAVAVVAVVVLVIATPSATSAGAVEVAEATLAVEVEVVLVVSSDPLSEHSWPVVWQHKAFFAADHATRQLCSSVQSCSDLTEEEKAVVDVAVAATLTGQPLEYLSQHQYVFSVDQSFRRSKYPAEQS